MPAFAAVAADPRFRVVAVVTAPPRPAGRSGALAPTPVGAWAAAAGLPLLEIARVRDAESGDRLLALDVDGALLADFGQIVPRRLLEGLGRGILNLHPSRLPRHRGASPIPATLLAGDTATAVATIQMDAGVDTGPIVALQPAAVAPDDTAETLEARLAGLAASGIGATLEAWLDGRISPVAQEEAGATLTGRLSRNDGRVGAGVPAATAYRTWRAYQPWPGAWVELADGTRLALVEVGPPRPAAGLPVGTLALDGDTLLLSLEGGALPLLRVLPAGGRAMGGGDFARGHAGLIGPHARIRA